MADYSTQQTQPTYGSVDAPTVLDPTTNAAPADAMTSTEPNAPLATSDVNQPPPAAGVTEAPSTPTGTKRKSGFGGFIKDLRSALPGKSKSPKPGSSYLADEPAASANTNTYDPTGPHPGTIISDQSHLAGNQPVTPPNPVHPAHRGMLTGVDLLITKEAEKVMNAMSNMVENSGGNKAEGDIPVGVRDTMYPHESQTHQMAKPTHKWMGNWEDNLLDKLFVADHMGNYVIVNRQTGQRIFESMPICTRLGMHLLFVSSGHEFLDIKQVEKLFADLSIRQGKTYNNADPTFVTEHIQSFVKTYSIPMDQLLQPDIKSYKTFNDFFSRQLKPSARPVSQPEDLSVLTSAADARLTVFESVESAKKFWVKGHAFSTATLLDDPHLAEQFGANPSIAIFRLAPQDYHRFHSPFRATLGKRSSIHGTYYTVNPQAVNENLNVFTANHREVQIMNVFTPSPMPEGVDATAQAVPAQAPKTIQVALVAVGAMLVGSIAWSKTGGQEVQKGEDLGYFQYGGSTVIMVVPEGSVTWDADLVKASSEPIETLVRVGEQIGRINF